MRVPRNVFLTALGFGALWVIYGQLSPGTFNDDDIVHYFMARQSLDDPSLWISLWGRPLHTFLYALPAGLGYWAVELLTAVISALTLVMTYKLAVAAGVRSRFAALLFTAFQPFFFKLGFSCLVEPLGGLVLTTGLWAMLVRRDRVAACMAGLLPLTRFELIFVALFVLVPAVKRRPRAALLIAAVPMFVWNLAGWFFEGDPLWLPAQLLGGHFTRSLAAQPLAHYFRSLPMVIGGAILPLFMLGLFPDTDRSRGGAANRLRGLFVVHLLVLAFLAWNIHAIGGSVGYLRHLVSLGPVIGILAALGFDRWGGEGGESPGRAARLALIMSGLALALVIPVFQVQRYVWEHPVIFGRDVTLFGANPWGSLDRALPASWFWPVAALAGVLCLIVWRRRPRAGLRGVVLSAELATLLTEIPIGLEAERLAMKDAADWVGRYAPRRVVAVNHPWFFFLGNYDRFDGNRFPTLNHETLDRLCPGSFVIWEDHYSPRLSGDVRLQHFADHPERYAPRARGFVSDAFKFVIFEVVADGGAS